MAASSHSVARGSSRLRQLLIGGEVALTVVLVAASGLLVRSLIYLETLPPGFDASNVMTAKLSLDDARYRDATAFHNLIERSVAAMHQIPGVENAAVGLSLPYERGLNDGVKALDGKLAGKEWGASTAYVSPEYFQRAENTDSCRPRHHRERHANFGVSLPWLTPILPAQFFE